MVRLSACLKAVTALTVEMTHKEQNRSIPTEPGTFMEINGQRSWHTVQYGPYLSGTTRVETVF